ncbi:MAG: ATP-binding protein [Desulfobacteraceae bacterium]
MAAADGKTSEQICALTREDDNGMNDVCLQVRVKPITLEATPKGGEIQLTVRTDTHSISWDVWNSAPIPEKIQQRIFQRHFSTKSGSGRGLGTYSMKLFGEKYLKGKISFSTSIETGTVFTFTLPLK